MIINAYKIDVANKEDNKVEEKKYSLTELSKEISNTIINSDRHLIESNNINKVKEKVVEYIFNYSPLKDDNIIEDIVQMVMDKIYGYGIIQKYIDNENISDIRIVKYNSIYVKEKGLWKKVNESFSDNKEFEDYVRFCALKNDTTINFEKPVAIFSDRKNSLRLEAGIQPVNVDSPSLVIRIHRKNKQINLENLFVQENMLDKLSYKIITEEIKPMSNIILCGKGGSGKTTLLKALIDRIPKEMAITSNEETAELYLRDRNIIQRECLMNRTESKNINLEELSRHSLVMSNDIIIIGELKGAEANSFFDSISTGHTGLATVHSDSSRNAIDRIITLIKKDIKAQYYTENFLRRLLSSSIDYIIYLDNFKVMEISKVNYNEESGDLKMRYIYNYKEIV